MYAMVRKSTFRDCAIKSRHTIFSPCLSALIPLVCVLSSKKFKTYNSWYSLVVTHPTTNQPISSLCMAERTGCPILLSLWSYVKERCINCVYILRLKNILPRSQLKYKEWRKAPGFNCIFGTESEDNSSSAL